MPSAKCQPTRESFSLASAVHARSSAVGVMPLGATVRSFTTSALCCVSVAWSTWPFSKSVA
eukprot:5570721-Pyramimonas_sp.AAC.1